jgi:hypothetical protein
LLQACRQHAFGGHQQLRLRTESAFEPNLPADFGANRPSALVGDALGNGAGRHAPRLEHDDRAILHQRRRQARRFSGARLGGDDNRPRSSNGIDDAVDERVDREGI